MNIKIYRFDTRVKAVREVSVPTRRGTRIKTYFAGKPKTNESFEDFVKRIEAKFGKAEIFDHRDKPEKTANNYPNPFD